MYERVAHKMQQSLLAELEQFITDLKQKEAATVYTIPDENMSAIKKAKKLENFLNEVLTVVRGSGGINMTNIIRREFGMSKELINHFDRWARHSKEQFEEALHDAIDRAEIRAGNQGIFFAGSADKKECAEALGLLKGIAHAAVRCQFHPKLAGLDTYVDMLDKLIQFYALPHTYPAGDIVNYKNLVSCDRLYAMSGNDDTITLALKAHAKEWYQQSSFTFLESKESYPIYEDVRNYLYALTEEQLERLRNDFIQNIRDDYDTVKAAKDLHRAEYLKAMLETVLSWQVS
jgi:hypothetical protein